MTLTRAALALTLASAAALAACGPTNNTPDGSDVTTDTPGSDATDTPTTSDADSSTGLVCNTLAVENLNALGTQAGDTTTLTSDNRMAPSNIAIGAQVPASAATACAFKIGHQRVFSYTPHTDSILRVSTSNPGTDPGFDTVVVILPSTTCSRTAALIGCNDDDPSFALDQRHVSSTAVAVQQVHANRPVLIGLGGFVPVSGARNEAREMGNFVLTVQELAPIADGGACNRRRLTDACADGSTCVSDHWPSDMGHCHTDGSAAGTLCDSSGACTGTGITCDPAGSGICVTTVTTAGMACDPYHACGTGLTCVILEAGSTAGTCLADGTGAGAACRVDPANLCDAGLICTPVGTGSFCQVAGVMNGACNTWDGTCPTGQDCVTPTASGRVGQCTNTSTTPGTHCVGSGPCTGTNVSCTMGTNFNVCQTNAAAGQPCGPYDTCGTGNTCYLTNLNDQYNGVCFTPGMVGGPCRMTAPNCDGSAVCSDTTTPANGRCVNAVAAGAACTLTDQCPTDSNCVQDGSGSAFMGHCHADGTVAGAPCRQMGTPCDGALSCSSWIPEEGVCQSAGTAGGMCDPRTASIHCPAGQVCRSSSILAGTCAAPVTETEPNDVPAASLTAITTPAAINAGLSSFDVDCYALNVPAGSGIYAAATAPSGVCGGLPTASALQISVYTLQGTTTRLLGEDLNSGTLRCPRIDAHDAEFAWARNTTAAAETMYVCVHNSATTRDPIAAYVVSLDVRP